MASKVHIFQVITGRNKSQLTDERSTYVYHNVGPYNLPVNSSITVVSQMKEAGNYVKHPVPSKRYERFQ